MLTRVLLSLMSAMILIFSSVPSTKTDSTPQFDLLIKNGTIIDGSGRLGYRTDLAVKGDRIVRIGRLQNAQAKRVIDATGMVVSPGFIDLLGQSESFVLIDPRAMSKV